MRVCFGIVITMFVWASVVVFAYDYEQYGDTILKASASDTGTNGKHDGKEETKPTYKVFHAEFHRVETPFIIGIWIFFASLAKIGTSTYCILIYLF